MRSSILIYGIGAMARVIASYIAKTHTIVGFTVDDIAIEDGQDQFLGRPLYPFSEVSTDLFPSDCMVIVAVGYRDMNALRLERIEQLEKLGFEVTGYCFPELLRHDGVEIHPTAIVLDHVSIHPGSYIGPHVFLTSQVNLGHDCHVAEGAWINGGVSIGGGAKIGASSVLSINASIAHGIELGERVFVGANTLVGRSVEDDRVVLSASGQIHRLKSRSFLKFSNLQD